MVSDKEQVLRCIFLTEDTICNPLEVIWWEQNLDDHLVFLMFHLKGLTVIGHSLLEAHPSLCLWWPVIERN